MTERKITIQLTLDQYQAIKDCLNFMKVNSATIHTISDDAIAWGHSVDRGLAAIKLEETDMAVEAALSHFYAPGTRVWVEPESERGQLLRPAVEEGYLSINWDSEKERHVYTLTPEGIEHKFPDIHR